MLFVVVVEPERGLAGASCKSGKVTTGVSDLSAHGVGRS